MRHSGTLRSWNDDRSFGFIAPTHGGAELFLHISALPKDGTRPTVGETLTYELGRGKNGQPQAVNVVRQAVGQMATRSRPSRPTDQRSRPWLTKTVAVLLLIALGVYGYGQYQKLEASQSQVPHGVAATVGNQSGVNADSQTFRCDGRTHCSQMTSCSEATYFLKNCPGVQMDGNGDGVPCEQQWCTGFFSK